MNESSLLWKRKAARLLGAGLFVAVASTVMLSAEAAARDGAEHHGGRGMLLGGPQAERLLDAVNASADQRSQVKQIMDVARNDMKAQREAGRAVRAQMHQLFSQPTVDARVAETLRQQAVAQHDQISRRMLQAMLDVSRVLTPEQRAKLAELHAERRSHMERRHRSN